MAWILEWSGFKNDDRPTTLVKTSWDTSGNEARKHTLLIKIVFYVLQCLELLLKEPVPAVSPPLNWGGGDGGGREKMRHFHQLLRYCPKSFDQSCSNIGFYKCMTCIRNTTYIIT